MLLKIVSRTILLSTCFLLLMPTLASAEDKAETNNSSNEISGKMNWKIDRVIKRDANRNKTETELEKSFPELFKVETTTTIHQVKEKNQESIEDLKKQLFTTDINSSATIEETKKILFNADYVAPRTADTEEEEDTSGSSPILMISLATLACVVSGAVFLLFQRLTG
ncbi:type VII secretion protein EssA [Gracilibacillus halotolerans]|uniref:Type VII secretion protein EssA n=1 Tax=Gracilibacillus halotolerans TaxID=74386 RepID=A0A841RPX0_9BACI|nr:type VII secretion protein EssA [Gracilibacillus halotolerans]MBB6512974.1 type VII secretion protein EssA [Gracilibacillus halotolerans]